MFLAVPKDAYLGVNAGATRANDLLRQADGSGQAHGDRPSPRTNPDDAERLTCIYVSEGWGSSPSGLNPEAGHLGTDQLRTRGAQLGVGR
jgi:hypothetical protein